MKIALKHHEGLVYRLPDVFAERGVQLVTIDGQNHLVGPGPGGYYRPALDGAQSATKNHTRRQDFRADEIHVCRECVRLSEIAVPEIR
jgi:hypothetical protein